MNADYLQVGLSKNNSLLIPTNNTVEVISRKRSDLCEIPGLLSSLLGVVNQRGRLLWILDLARLLGWADDRARKLDREELTIVIVAKDRETIIEEQQAKIGCLVANLEEMISIENNLIEPVDPKNQMQIGDIFSGITASGTSSLPILNTANLLNYLQSNSSIYE